MDDELERIRERKRNELRKRVEAESQTETQTTETHSQTPITVEGPAHLEQLLETHSTVLVDFYADWCGPCQMLAPILDRLAAETPATIAKVDTDAYPALAQQYGVRGLPTLILFENGTVAQQLVGMQQEDRLRALLT